MARMTNFRSAAIATGNAIDDSAYDNVKLVAEQLSGISAVADLVTEQGVDFALLANVLNTLGDTASTHLATLAGLDLEQLISDLEKGNYLGNRKIDIDLALNIQGITEKILREDPTTAEALWTANSSKVTYDSATITFTDGVSVELPFLSDNNPTVITNTDGLLVQLNRTDVVNAVVQEDLIYSFTVLDSTVYTVTIDNIDFTYTSGVGATRGEIVTGLTNQINVGTNPWTAYNETDNVRIKADVAGNPFLTTVDANMLVRIDVANVIAGNYPTAFLDKLEDTSYNSFTLDSVSNTIRFFDITGKNSNIEKIQLHTATDATNFNDNSPIYYWAKTTSALETLSMRAGDIIKIGNEIDNIILLASSIEQLLVLQDRIPEFIDTYVDGVPQGTTSIYNKLAELDEIYTQLQAIITIYADIKPGGTNHIATVVADLSGVNNIGTVADDLNLGVDSKIKEIHDNLSTIQNAYTNATNAAASAVLASEKADTIVAIDGNQVVQALAAGSTPSAYYNATTGKFTFGIPNGPKGDKGDSFTVNSVGLIADRSVYDTQVKGFSFLAIDEGSIYFKLSDTSGDWSAAAPFGKGETGNGIDNISWTSTTGTSQGEAGETDTYTITYTDTTVDTFVITNGSIPTKADLGLDNVNNTSDMDKPISTLVQIELDSINGKIINTVTPVVTITTSVNERTVTQGSYTSVSGSTTTITASTGTISNHDTVNKTFDYTAPDITDGNDDADTITAYSTKAGELKSIDSVTNMTIIFVPTSADTTIQVTDIYNDLETNTGFEEIV